jgi:hypothetical protein
VNNYKLDKGMYVKHFYGAIKEIHQIFIYKLPVALAWQSQRTRPCVQTHRIFYPVLCLVEPQELFPACPALPGLQRRKLAATAMPIKTQI